MKKVFLILVVLLLLSGFEQPVIEVSVETEENINYEELLDYLSLFKTGDIINIENSNYLSSYAIPGRWKHTVFYLGTIDQIKEVFNENDQYYQEIIKHYHQDEVLVLDSNSSGVKIRTLDQMANLKKESYLKALVGYRFYVDQDFIKTYLNRALDYLNTPYDYAMTSYDEQALYCSELVYYALKSVNLEVDQTTSISKHVVITPTDLGDYLDSLRNVSSVYLLKKHHHQVINEIND